MSKYTKAQRHSIYCFMLAEAEEPSMETFDDILIVHNYGFCALLKYMFSDETFDFIRYYVQPSELPELAKREPPKYDKFWFDRSISGWKKRKQLLRDCIEETADF